MTVLLLPDIVPSAKAKRGLIATRVVIILLAVVMLAVLFVRIIIPFLLRADEEARKRQRQCANNVTQIGLAILNYERANGHFPPAFVADKNGKPKHSWRVLILPYLEQGELYRQYRMEEPWDSPHNIKLMSQMPACYRCPFAGLSTGATNYAMLVGPHAFSDGPTGRKSGDIKDGASATIMVVETAGEEINWLEPRDVNAEKVVEAARYCAQTHPNRRSGTHDVGFYAVFCNGYFQKLSYDIDSKKLRAAMTIDGGEQADVNKF